MINTIRASQFLSNFEGNQILISMKDDNKSAPWHMHKEFDDCVNALVKRNEKNDCGIFFTVNELDRSLDPEHKRTGAMWVRGRALFIDDDVPRSQPRSDFPLLPNLIVSTSSGKYHYYWLIKGGVTDKQEYLSVQASLVSRFDGDGNVKDVTRYLRLPGFMHRKMGSDGVVNDRVVTYIDNELEKYEFSELKNEFGTIENKKTGSNIRNNSTTGGHNEGTTSRSDRGNIGNLGGLGLESGNMGSDHKSIDESVNEIANGLNYHENIVSLSYQMIKEGIAEPYVVMAIQGFMNQVLESKRDERWQGRYDDIERICRGGIHTAAESLVNIENLGASVEVGVDMDDGVDIPWPPGLMGKLADDAYNMARYQYKPVALVSAIGLVAGIAGRKFNISDTGLNVYLTLIMGTGMGKDSIGKFINNALVRVSDTGAGSSFIGAKRFTGPKAVINHLKDARSRVCVFTEAGILMRSATGDQDGLTRLLLGLYTCSGKDDFSGVEEFSSIEGRITSIRAPALTIVNEATPETLLEAFADSGALENGHLPRQSVFRVHGDKPYPNTNIQKELSPECRDVLVDLVKKCATVQSADSFECWEFDFDKDVKDDVLMFQKMCVDMENQHRGEDGVKSIMVSRMYMKAVKFAAICSVINKGGRHASVENGSLLISRPEWEWGAAVAQHEYSSIDSMFSGHGGDLVEDLALGVVRRAILKLLRDGYKSKNVRLTKIQMDNQEIPYASLYQIFRKNAKMREMSKYDKSSAGGLKAVLDHMVSVGYLKLSYRDKSSSAYRDRVGSDESPSKPWLNGESVAFVKTGNNIYRPTKLLMVVT